MKTKSKGIVQFFAEDLGAPLRTCFSWGALDSAKTRVFLRVWEDTIDGQFIMVLRKEMRLPGQRQNYDERKRHIEMMRAGSEALGVLCTSVESDPKGRPRVTKTFDADDLLKLGRLVEKVDGLYAEIEGYVQRTEVVD